MKFAFLSVLLLTTSAGVSANPAAKFAKPSTIKATPVVTKVSVPATDVAPAELPVKAYPAISKAAAVWLGQLFAMNSGFVNACCMSGSVIAGVGQPVAAVTGAYTNAAIHLGGNKMAKAVGTLRVLGAYLAGSAIYGLLNPTPKPFEYHPAMAAAMGMQSLLWAGCAYVAVNKKSPLCFVLAAMACGLQNSVTSVHTSNLVRSAHFSGVTSDIGTFLGQALRGNGQNKEKLVAFVRLALSFFLGSLLAVTVVAPKLGANSLYVASGIQLAMFLVATLFGQKK